MNITRTEYLFETLAHEKHETILQLKSQIAFLQQQLQTALTRLNEGQMPNTCGVVQKQGVDIDMAVARLFVVEETLKQVKLIREEKAK